MPSWENLLNLEDLNLSENSLSSLPPSLGHCPSLRSLHI